mmetsp:Transcript_49851/g.157749  ORF Transcript_49851/g.157749 Transcript_49851/m.157749 type:complete len:217 (+) Transcript_49851:103-753(+)
MSLHADHTCAVSSQSHRQPSTYSPGGVSAGTRTVSRMLTVVGQLPAHGPGLLPYSPTALGARTFGSKPARHLAGKALSLMGNGFIAHIEPAGYVPSVTYVPLISSTWPSLHRSSCDPSKARCLWRKHSSVSASPFGHSRNAYPPPWLARMNQPVCPSPPAAHTTPVGASGSLEPRSPCLANCVALYSPLWTPATGPPPAMPHASKMGAVPGALQGL